VSKMREAFEKWFYGSKYAQVIIPQESDKQIAWDGYQAAIADVKAGGPVAWHSPLRYGSHTTFRKPNPPQGFDDFYDDWFCTPLYKLPEDA